jgi:ABC-2 type transport system permease protein
MTAVRHAWYMTVRHLRALWRQPWWIAVTLVQPVIWLLLYGALFKRWSTSPASRAAPTSSSWRPA